jgi:hypothetical protein
MIWRALADAEAATRVSLFSSKNFKIRAIYLFLIFSVICEVKSNVSSPLWVNSRAHLRAQGLKKPGFVSVCVLVQLVAAWIARSAHRTLAARFAARFAGMEFARR